MQILAEDIYAAHVYATITNAKEDEIFMPNPIWAALSDEIREHFELVAKYLSEKYTIIDKTHSQMFVPNGIGAANIIALSNDNLPFQRQSDYPFNGAAQVCGLMNMAGVEPTQSPYKNFNPIHTSEAPPFGRVSN